MKTSKNIGIFFIIVFIIGMVTVAIKDVFALEGKHLYARGEVVNCFWVSRGVARYVVEVKFDVQNNTYKASTELHCTEFDYKALKEKLMGIQVPVSYNPENPTNNEVILEKPAFIRNKLAIPDTLIPIVRYLDCEKPKLVPPARLH